MSEYRSIPRAAVKVDDAGSSHRIRADVCPYNVVDSYGTRWNHGVWTRSLEARKPPMAWAHDWTEPIGRLIDVDDNPKRLQTLHELDDFEAVPRARQAYTQIQSGTITDFSFGFSRQPGGTRADKDNPEIEDMLDCDLDEVSPVLRGAVPGAKAVGLRGISPEFVAELGRQVQTGEMELDRALNLVNLAGGVRSMHVHAKQDGSGTMKHSHQNDGAMHAHSGMMPVSGNVTIGRAMRPVFDGAYMTTAVYPATQQDSADASDSPSGGTPEDAVRCADCGALNATDAKYCDQCGSALPMEGRSAEDALVSEARDALTLLRRRR